MMDKDKTMCGAACRRDHRLVVSKLNLRIQPALRSQNKKTHKRAKPRQHETSGFFINDIYATIKVQ